MDYKLTEEHLMIRQAARDFANQECLPGVIKRDEKMIFPKNRSQTRRAWFYRHDGKSKIWWRGS